MTEKEFMQQVWRPYDTVLIEGEIKGRVVNVCFPTRSVRISMKNGAPEWFNCNLVIEHKSQTGETTDLAIIDNLREKLLAADKKIHDLQLMKEKLEKKLKRDINDDVLKSLNIIKQGLVEKKSRAEKLERGLTELESVLEKIKREVFTDSPES